MFAEGSLSIFDSRFFADFFVLSFGISNEFPSSFSLKKSFSCFFVSKLITSDSSFCSFSLSLTLLSILFFLSSSALFFSSSALFFSSSNLLSFSSSNFLSRSFSTKINFLINKYFYFLPFIIKFSLANFLKFFQINFLCINLLTAFCIFIDLFNFAKLK